jgi:anaphase-promoting complex subunit 10
MPVLRAHLVQIKIMENHQNGKDTHLRGLQIFARNDEGERSPVRGGKMTVSEGVQGISTVGGGLGEVGRTRLGRRGKEEVLELGGLSGEGDIR